MLESLPDTIDRFKRHIQYKNSESSQCHGGTPWTGENFGKANLDGRTAAFYQSTLMVSEVLEEQEHQSLPHDRVAAVGEDQC